MNLRVYSALAEAKAKKRSCDSPFLPVAQCPVIVGRQVGSRVIGAGVGGRVGDLVGAQWSSTLGGRDRAKTPPRIAQNTVTTRVRSI